MAGAGAREGKQERAVRRINRRFWQLAGLALFMLPADVRPQRPR